ncbi:terminase [Actinomycetaceae bacterium MB13-C1-2]|nr:terminase [Actinomycetaceae bacterium MB13-C1-2]
MTQSQKTKPGTRKRSNARPPSKPSSQDRKLSEVARHVVKPKGIVSTGWPMVRDRCRQFGIPFDRWQDGIGRLALSKRADGKYAAGVGGVILSIPRQVGKTYLIGWMMFALCSLIPGLTVIWTAHHTRTSDETFTKMQAMARKPKVAAYLDGPPRAANGQQMVKFKNGSRILFGARSQGFGLGFDKVDVLVLDEAQRVNETTMADMVPATNAAPNGLIFMMGTPPRPADNGDEFANRRNDALEGDPDTAYVELSADEDAKIIDWDQIAKCNPSYPHRTDKTAILRMRKFLSSDDNFRREAYGIWDKSNANHAIDFPKWRRLTVDADEAPSGGRVAYAVRFSVDGMVAGLAVACKPSHGPIHVEGIEVFDMTGGIGPILDFLVPRAPDAAQIVIDGKRGADMLIEALRDVGVRNKKLLIKMTPDLVTAACAELLQALTDMSLTHIGQEVLDRQVEFAVPRKIGPLGGFGWDAPEGENVALLEAVTYAFWAVKHTKRRSVNDLPGGVVLTR